jgi:hypothetical protein
MSAPTIAVPLNTMLADLDETLRRLLKEELGHHSFDGVEVAFDAPTREWAAALSTPAVNLFMYDLREAVKRRGAEWASERRDGRTHDVRPPLRLEISYAVTAWARRVEDEHRLLSQVLGVLYAHHTLPSEALIGTLANGSQPFPLETTVGQPKSDGKVDFWSAVGGQYKASLDYVVLASCVSGTRVERGPDTESQTVRVLDPEGGRSAVEERHILRGVVRDADGDPAPSSWLTMPDDGGWTVSDADGRFLFRGVGAGRHRLQVRGAEGGAADLEVDVPGRAADVTLSH